MVRWHIAFAGRVQEQLQLGLEPWLSDKASENMGRSSSSLTGSLPIGWEETMRSDSSLAPVLEAP